MTVGFSVCALDISGAYTGEFYGDDGMLIVRQVGGARYHFQLFSVQEIILRGEAKAQADGRYQLTADRIAMLQFKEGRCLFSDIESDETISLPKLFGSPGMPDGTYAINLRDGDGPALLTVRSKGDNLAVEMEGWDIEEEAYGAANSDHRYVIGDPRYPVEFVFSDGLCEIDDDGESITMNKDQPLYVPDWNAMSGDFSIEGVFRGESFRSGDRKVTLMVSRGIGGGFFAFEIFTSIGRQDFGSGVAKTEEGKRIVRLNDLRFIYDEESLTFIHETFGEQVIFEKIARSDGDAGLYYHADLENGMAMVLEVTLAGDTYNAGGEIYEPSLSYTSRISENHIYGLGEGRSGVLVTFGAGDAMIVTDGALIALDRIGRFAEGEKGTELSGVIPDISDAGSKDELFRAIFPDGLPVSAQNPADQIAIDTAKSLEISLEGFSPTSISPNGRLLFGMMYDSIAVYDTESQKFVFAEAFQGRIDFPAVRWSPDSTRIAFTEDFFRMMQESDIHIIDLQEGVHKNITDDGADRFSLNRPGNPVDIVPTWIEDGDRMVFLRMESGEDRARTFKLVLIDTVTGEHENISPSLSDRPTIINLFFDPLRSKIYYTEMVSRPDDPANGVWVMDPALGRPVQVYRGSRPGQEISVAADVSADGEWMLIRFPRAADARQLRTDNRNAPPKIPAFSLFHLDSEKEFPILEESDTMTVQNVVFSPDGSKVLFVYGSKDSQERFVAVKDVGDSEAYELYTVQDPTAGISPMHSGASGSVGLAWCNNDSVFVSIGFGSRALILRLRTR